MQPTAAKRDARMRDSRPPRLMRGRGLDGISDQTNRVLPIAHREKYNESPRIEPEIGTAPSLVCGAVEWRMPEPTVRDQIKQVLDELPPDATFEDAIERLVFLAKIDAGLAELDAGQGVPHDEVKRRLGM